MTAVLQAGTEGRGKKDEPLGNVLVTFFTTTFPASMPEQTYSVPVNVLPDGLCTLVQSVLKVDSAQRFDFLYNDEYIGTSLERFLLRRGVSFEDIVNIEYTPALQAKEGSLLPHDDWVSSVRAPYLGDGETLLTGAYDHCVRLWDGENCLALGTFHKECVKEVALRSDRASREAASAGGGQKRPRKTLEDFSFVSCSKDGSIAGWQYDSKASQFHLLGSISAHTDGIDSVCVSPSNGRLVATASWDSTVKVYQWSQLVSGGTDDDRKSTKAPLLCFTDHTRPVLTCRFSEAHGDSRLYSAGLDGRIKCLDVSSAEMTGQYNCDHAVNSVSVKPLHGGNGADAVLAGCTDNRARLFDSRQQKAVMKTFSGHRQWIYSVCWLWNREEGESQSSGGELFATASEDATLRIYDLRSTTTALLTLDTQHTDAILDVTYAGQSVIASGGKDNKTKSFSLTKEV